MKQTIKEIIRVCEVCKKNIKGAAYINIHSKQFECKDCYISKKSLIK